MFLKHNPFVGSYRILHKTGSFHQNCGSPNEDIILANITPELCFWGIADGQTHKTHCREGALVSLKTVHAFSKQLGISNMIHYAFPDELPFLLLHQIRSQLMSLSMMTGEMIHEYSSTIIATAIDPGTGNGVMIHLGDGCCIGTTADHCEILSRADYVLSSCTWLTTTANSAYHMRITPFNIHKYRRLFIMSDGCYKVVSGDYIPQKTKNIMIWESIDTVIDYFTHNVGEDDFSCIMIEINS